MESFNGLPVVDSVWNIDSSTVSSDDNQIEVFIKNKFQNRIGETVLCVTPNLEMGVMSFIFDTADRWRKRPKILNILSDTIALNIKSTRLSDLGIDVYSKFFISKVSRKHLFRECTWCHERATREFFKKCSDCQTVFLCKNNCRMLCNTSIIKEENLKNDAQDHNTWCQKLKEHNESSTDIINHPFFFSKETTSEDFDMNAYTLFLKNHGVLGEGLWKVETEPIATFPLNCDEEFSYVLPVEDIILGEKPEKPVSSGSLGSWKEYYAFRGLRLDSPVAILLQWPLTLYHILHTLMAQSSSFHEKSHWHIDIVGAGKETCILYVFQELGFLMPTKSITLHFYGKEFSRSFNNHKISWENVNITVHHSLYQQCVESTDGPDIIIGFNAGLAAYSSWKKTIEYIKETKIPAYFTDYSQQSINLSKEFLLQKLNVHVTEPFLNPFRAPNRIFDPECTIPLFSNVFIYNVVHI